MCPSAMAPKLGENISVLGENISLKKCKNMCKQHGSEFTVEVVRMSRGRRMTEDTFELLPEKDKVRVLRNRRNALKTRHNRQARLKQLDRQNALLEANIKLKTQQVELLLALRGTGKPAPVAGGDDIADE
jgi:hypothetical protein